MQIEMSKNRTLPDLTQAFSRWSKGKAKENLRVKVERLKKKMKALSDEAHFPRCKTFLKLSCEVRPKNADKIRKRQGKANYEKENQQSFQPPRAPQNTSQFLIANFKLGRTEQVMNLLSDYSNYLEDDHYAMMVDELISIDDMCVSGGSMKGIITFQSNDEASDEKTNLTYLSNYSHLNDGSLNSEYFDQEEECNNYLNCREKLNATYPMDMPNGIINLPLSNQENVLEKQQSEKNKCIQEIIRQREEIRGLQNQIEKLNSINKIKILET